MATGKTHSFTRRKTRSVIKLPTFAEVKKTKLDLTFEEYQAYLQANFPDYFSSPP